MNYDITDIIDSIMIPKGLVARWKGNGNAKDQLGRYDGIASKGVTYAQGVRKEAFSFNGEDGIVSTKLTVSYNKGVTFDAWVKTTDDSGLVMSDGGGASKEKGMGLFVEPGGTIDVFGSKGTERDFNFHIKSPRVINDNLFHHVAATWTGDTSTNGVALYVDGQAVAVATAKEAITEGSTYLYIGRHETLKHHAFAGLMDEVKVFNHALEPGEIAGLSRR